MESINVFIVEDDPMVVSINKQFTEKVRHFKVIGTSTTENDALTKIKDLNPDLILIDVFLPNGNGLSLIKQIRMNNIPTDIILVTAARDTTTIQEALRLGAVDYLIKPFDFERLQQALLNYEHLRHLMNDRSDVSQDELDQYNYPIETGGIKGISSLPKGVHLFTLKQILNYLSGQHEPQSCQQIADALSLSKITAWRYLEYLVEKGKVNLIMEYGSIGRPTKHYIIIHNQ